MPKPAAQRVCAAAGCPLLTTSRYCPTHTQQYEQRTRGDHRHIYNTKRWKILRKQILKRDKYQCAIGGPTCPYATDVDHIIPLTDYTGSPYNPHNLQSLCHSHHSQKTATEILHRQP